MGHFVVWSDMVRNVSDILAEAEEGLRVGDVVRRAVGATRDGSPQMFRRKKNADLPKERYPWRDLEGSFINLLARSNFIEDDEGNVMARGPVWQLKRGRLRPMPEEWPETLEGQLVLELIRACGDVQWSDGEDLAGAIYLSRDPEMVDRMDRVIESLFDAGLIEASDPTQYLYAT